MDKPLTEEIMQDPNRPEVKLILYLYSWEPPFYADLNNASRVMDEIKLKTLGPFARALYGALVTYSDQHREDALELGFNLHQKGDSLGHFSGSFLVFRGALMNKEWIEDWRRKVGRLGTDFTRLHGTTSTSKNLEVALGFS